MTTSKRTPGIRSNSNDGCGNLGVPGSLNTTLHMPNNTYLQYAPRYLEEQVPLFEQHQQNMQHPGWGSATMTSGPMTLREDNPNFEGTLNINFPGNAHLSPYQDKENTTRNGQQAQVGRSSSADLKARLPPQSDRGRHFYNLSSNFNSKKADLNQTMMPQNKFEPSLKVALPKHRHTLTTVQSLRNHEFNQPQIMDGKGSKHQRLSATVLG